MADSAIVTGAIEGFLSLFGVAVLYFFMQGVVKWANKQLAVPRAAAQDDVFSTQYGYSWDFVLGQFFPSLCSYFYSFQS
jgi:hypothetical protein